MNMLSIAVSKDRFEQEGAEAQRRRTLGFDRPQWHCSFFLQLDVSSAALRTPVLSAFIDRLSAFPRLFSLLAKELP